MLKNDFLDKRHDGVFSQFRWKNSFHNRQLCCVPDIFPGGDIGGLAVHGTVNDLGMCGAIPKYLSLSFIIEEGMPVQEFWDILISIKFTCQQENVQVVTGDTKVNSFQEYVD